MTISAQKMNGRDSAHYGAIFTIRNLETAETEVHHRGGLFYETGSRRLRTAVVHKVTLYDVVREFCRELDERPDPWRIVTISTPRTILADLNGKPVLDGDARKPPPPEALILSKAGRIDMWDGTHEMPEDQVRRARVEGAAGWAGPE